MFSKKIVLMLVLVGALGTSCSDDYDDTLLNSKVEDLTSRVEKLEQLAQKMNNEIGSLQTIVSKLESNIGVLKIEEVTNAEGTKGYRITFTDSTTAEIYNGKDGQDGKDGTSPKIGVKKFTDGLYYWTLNDEFIEAEGKKLPVKGEKGEDGLDGKDGTTPQVRINSFTSEWEISTNNGFSWSPTGVIAKGEKGEKGDSFFSNVVESEDKVDFILTNGETISLPKGSLFAIHLSTTELHIAGGETLSLNYTLEGATAGCFVEAYAKDGYTADVDEGTQRISITAPAEFTASSVTVVYSNGVDKTVIARINLLEPIVKNLQTIGQLNKISDTSAFVQVDVENASVVDVTTDCAIITDASGEYFAVQGNVAQLQKNEVIDINGIPARDKFGFIHFTTDNGMNWQQKGTAAATPVTYKAWKGNDVAAYVGNNPFNQWSTEIRFRAQAVELEGIYTDQQGKRMLEMADNMVYGTRYDVELVKGTADALQPGAKVKVRGFALGADAIGQNRILRLYVSGAEMLEEPQPEVLIERAPFIANTYFFPMWKNHGTLPAVANSLNNLSQFTFECLLNFGAFTPTIQSIMGVEDLFLVRVNDGVSLNPDQLEIVVRGQSGKIHKLNDYQLSFNNTLSKWFHLAVVADLVSSRVKCYINGKLIKEFHEPDLATSVCLWTDFEEEYKNPHSFFIGRSYDNNRPFQGLLSEVRIWNKCLSESEINAKNHFYIVRNPESEENLLAYWRLNEGSGMEFMDHSKYHNNLKTYNEPATWVPVRLPE